MLLLENALSQEIKKLLSKENKLRIAVAFIGDGACNLINQKTNDVKIICNLTMGGTNPTEVKALINRFNRGNVKHVDNLHAKLYIGTEYAIVGSANMSANGLGTQPHGLREAGYQFKMTSPSGQRSADWFDTLWGAARDMTDEDLKNAEDKWKRRQRTRCGDWQADSGKICDYDFDRDDFPLITWYQDDAWSVSANLKEGKTKKQCEEFEDDVGNSVDIECANDIQHLSSGRYIIVYHKLQTGFAAKLSRDCSTLRSRGIVVRGAYHRNSHPGNHIDIMLCDETSALFGLGKSSFYNEFRDLINEDKYILLRDYGQLKPCWFDPRIDLMRNFWKELQSKLCNGNAQMVFTEE